MAYARATGLLNGGSHGVVTKSGRSNSSSKSISAPAVNQFRRMALLYMDETAGRTKLERR